jgi:tetratricopeptide (TPR) repeat protein
LNATIDQLIESGRAEHWRGNAQAAFQAYNAAFALEPHNPRLNHLLGTLLMQEGDYRQACPFLESAVSREPGNTVFNFHLGSALFRLEDFPAAARYFKRAIKADKTMAMAWLGLGRCHRAAGDIAEARRCFKTAIKHEAHADQALLELGFCYLDAGELDKAHRQLTKADTLKASFQTKLALLRVAAHWKNLKRVAGQVEQALRYANRDVEDLRTLIAVLDELRIRTGMDQALYQLAVAQFDRGETRQAVATLEAVLKVNPEKIAALISLGAYLTELGLYDQAADRFSAAFRLIDRQPDHATELLYRQAIHLKERGRYVEARAALHDALARDPDSSRLLYGLAVIAELEGNNREALDFLNRALERDPQQAECSFEKALVLLSEGQFEPAWQHYAFRFPATEGRTYLPHPFKADVILPAPEPGLLNQHNIRRICLLMEQGIGDQIFFSRYIPLLARADIEVIALVDPRLQSILARGNALAAVYSPEDFTPEAFATCDGAIGFGDLPLVCQHRAASETPPPLPLLPDDAARQGVAELFANHSGPFLGLTWQAGNKRKPGQASSLHKHVPVAELMPLLNAWPGTIVSIQRNPDDDELAALRGALDGRLLDLSRCNDDLEVMLAVLARFDHYIGVSNTNLHLYAGLGKSASVLVPFASDWRWMSEGEQSPWFPEFRLFRQQADGCWRSAIATAQHHLLAHNPDAAASQSAPVSFA